MLHIGSKAPDLTLRDHEGRPFRLADAWSDKHVVLFFYPKAHTSVCTKEACAFRDALANITAKGAVIIGISNDDSATQQDFRTMYQLPFMLLSDADGQAASAYGVRSFFGLMSGRVTYVVQQGGIIRGAYSGLLKADAHVQQALRTLEGQGNA
jgi:peroxiredoxin Q/BCP